MPVDPDSPLSDVSRETLAALEHYHAAIQRWSARINLVSPRDTGDLWNRHIRDCAQLYRLAGDSDGRWCDLGSGGGLPGLVVAILAKDHHPTRDHVLIESDQRKCAFLRVMATELGLRARIVASRAETADPARARWVSARALAPLDRLLPLVARHLDTDGVALLPKGANHAAELATVTPDWTFDLDIATSEVSPVSVILQIRNLKPSTRPR